MMNDAVVDSHQQLVCCWAHKVGTRAYEKIAIAIELHDRLVVDSIE